MMKNQSLVHTQKTELRSPETVMRLARMGSFHQSRLSFMRVLLRRLRRENWTFDRPVFDINEQGVGVATYRAIGPERTYTLVAFAHDLPDELRSDRVIAEAWDATFSLVDGEATAEDIERLSKNVPLQEAGRISGKEFVLSRANRSVRLFNHVRECLANGKQPDPIEIEKVGYLMRTTAVYGSGKFGAADRVSWSDRPEFSGSFQPELLSVWLIREFARDLVEHLAGVDGGEKAVRMTPEISRMLGIGNSTGLGMAPFLMNHPMLIHSWINARETAFATVRAIETASQEDRDIFKGALRKAILNAEGWYSEHPLQVAKLADLRAGLDHMQSHIDSGVLDGPYPWENLYDWVVSNCPVEAQEQAVSLMLEPYGEIVDDLSTTMCADERAQFRIDGTMPIRKLREKFASLYGWANELDFDEKSSQARIWYTSQEKLEPRLGDRFEEDLEPYEQPLAPARDAMLMKSDLDAWQDGETVAAFLMKHPDHRHMVRRLQMLGESQYGEIRDNTIAAEMLPIDLLRCKLSFFGATRFDPRSDRWVRITMYKDAPYPHELADTDPDACFLAATGEA